MTATYCTVAEVRAYTHLSTTEWSDAELTALIERVQSKIDFMTSRTWQGVTTVTDEYYDGTGTDTLYLKHGDIVAVTSIAIDDDYDGTYTSLDEDDDIHIYAEGYLRINRDNSAIPVFSQFPKAVKITYTYGTATVPDYITDLALLMVVDYMQPDTQRGRQIKEYIDKLKLIGPLGLI